jgi:nucleoside-diphosphate kinase
MERTLVLIKPDGLQRRLVGEVISRLERKGLLLIGMKMQQMHKGMLARHYQHLLDRSFYPEFTEFMMSAPVVATCWEGVEAVATVRTLCGVTNGREADPGTIRGDLSISVQANIVHASETPRVAQDEIDAFFSSAELFEYADRHRMLLYSKREIPK